MNPIRDFKLKETYKQNRKENLNPVMRGVITDSEGNQSGTNTIWADYNTRRVWWMKHGATQPAQIRCQRIPSPFIGLKVIAGYAPGSPEIEILSDDPLDRVSNTNGSNWTTLDTPDLLPGGRAMLWLQPKAIEPLATYPGTGLAVNINPGDYVYGGIVESYAGISDYDISGEQPAGPNEHCLVGLYLDGGGILNIIAGATVGTGLTPPEPAWPDNVFRLSATLITDTDTSFVMADIYDRRWLWADPYPGWPYAHVLTVDQNAPNADYATIQDAIDGASDGDCILIGAGTYYEALVITDKQLALIGLGEVIIDDATSDATLEIDATGLPVYLDNLKIYNHHNGGSDLSYGLLLTDCDGGFVRNCYISADGNNGGGSADDCVGVYVDTNGSDVDFFNCEMYGSLGDVDSIGISVAGDCVIRECYCFGDGTTDVDVQATGTISITNSKLGQGDLTNNGTATGNYVDGLNDNLVIIAGNELDTDTINETTAATGVTVDGVLLKDDEVYPRGDQLGLSYRSIWPYANWTSHFRDAVNPPAGYGWLPAAGNLDGAAVAAPTVGYSYSRLGEALYFRQSNVANRSALYKSAVANIANKNMYARVGSSTTGGTCIRLDKDDGAGNYDNYWYEFRFYNTATPLAGVFEAAWKNGGAVTTYTGSVNHPLSLQYPIRLSVSTTAPNQTISFFVVDEFQVQKTLYSTTAHRSTKIWGSK